MSVHLVYNLRQPLALRLDAVQDPYQGVRQWRSWPVRHRYFSAAFVAMGLLSFFYFKKRYLGAGCLLPASVFLILSHKARGELTAWEVRREFRQVCESATTMEGRITELIGVVDQFETPQPSSLGRVMAFFRVPEGSPVIDESSLVPTELQRAPQRPEPTQAWRDLCNDIRLLVLALQRRELGTIRGSNEEAPLQERMMNFYGSFLQATETLIYAARDVSQNPASDAAWGRLLDAKLYAAYLLRLYCCRETEFTGSLDHRVRIEFDWIARQRAEGEVTAADNSERALIANFNQTFFELFNREIADIYDPRRTHFRQPHLEESRMTRSDPNVKIPEDIIRKKRKRRKIPMVED